MQITHDKIVDQIRSKTNEITTWLESKETDVLLPFYSSIDIRDAGFKIAGVDTNLFPAGFNNISPNNTKELVIALKETILKRVPNCKNILFVSEEHTRNKWYLEHVRILNDMIKQAGFNVKTAAFLNADTPICQEKKSAIFETATGNTIELFCLNHVLKTIDNKAPEWDLIILNNDLSDGIPKALLETDIPTYPSVKAGWHSRLKSHHFTELNKLITEFCDFIGLDPWFLTCLFKTSRAVDINNEDDRKHLYELTTELFDDIQKKYDQYGITEKPFIFLKSDKGTYGMGVQAIEDPNEILNFNRKQRNKLYKGKGSQVITNYILQEGVPTQSQIENQSSEICIYQIANHFAGGFHRLNSEKNSRDNLNSTGMTFQSIHDAKSVADLDIYKIISRLHGIAAHREITQLESR